MVRWPYLPANAAAFLSLERSRPENDKRQPKLSGTLGIIWFLVTIQNPDGNVSN